MSAQVPKKNGHYTSTAQAAKMLGKDERTIRRWMGEGKLASSKLNGQRLIPMAEVELLLQQMPDLAPSDTEQLKTMAALLQEHEARLKMLEAENQELRRLVEQRQSTGAGGGEQPRRHAHQGKGRYYDPALRGLPAGSLRLSDFVAAHQGDEHPMERHTLELLQARGEVSMTLHQMRGPSGRFEWWLTPEQQEQALAHYPQLREAAEPNEAPALSN